MICIHSLNPPHRPPPKPENHELGWNLPCSVLFLKMYFSHLKLTSCANSWNKPFTWLVPISQITRYVAIHTLEFPHKQSLFKIQLVVSARCSFWLQWKQRRKRVFQNGMQWLLSTGFPRFFAKKMSAAYMLFALSQYGEIPPQQLLQCVLSTVYAFV